MIVAPSFGDIFRTNSLKVGLLTVTLPEDEVRALMAAGQGAELTVDLEEQTVGPYRFELDPVDRRRLLEGLDDIGDHARSTRTRSPPSRRPGPPPSARLSSRGRAPGALADARRREDSAGFGNRLRANRRCLRTR